MAINRIVSFLPSATELLFELGADEKLFGVTHECKYPIEANKKPQVISSVINSDRLSSKEIDEMTCTLLAQNKDIFQLNEKNLKNAKPDLIISQETCKVCAAYTNQVNKAIQILEKKPELHSMDPHNVQEIIQSVTKLGKILELESKAEEVSKKLESKVMMIKKLKIKSSPKILAIEWIEPFFTAGHWVPEMIEIAGGQNMISRTGERSRRMQFEEIVKASPDVIILMPCGFNVNRTISEYNKILKKNEKWNSLQAVKENQVYAVDADSFFSKPSIRTIEGIEILAKIINPEETEDLRVSDNAFAKIDRS